MFITYWIILKCIVRNFPELASFFDMAVEVVESTYHVVELCFLLLLIQSAFAAPAGRRRGLMRMLRQMIRLKR